MAELTLEFRRGILDEIYTFLVQNDYDPSKKDFEIFYLYKLGPKMASAEGGQLLAASLVSWSSYEDPKYKEKIGDCIERETILLLEPHYRLTN